MFVCLWEFVRLVNGMEEELASINFVELGRNGAMLGSDLDGKLLCHFDEAARFCTLSIFQ